MIRRDERPAQATSVPKIITRRWVLAITVLAACAAAAIIAYELAQSPAAHAVELDCNVPNDGAGNIAICAVKTVGGQLTRPRGAGVLPAVLSHDGVRHGIGYVAFFPHSTLHVPLDTTRSVVSGHYTLTSTQRGAGVSETVAFNVTVR